MGIKKFIHAGQLLSINSLRLLAGNLGSFGMMALFDALFLVSLFGLQMLFNYFAQFLVIPSQLTAMAFFYIALTSIYFLVILFAYSFFKYGLLYSVKSLFDKTEFSFNRLWRFYLLNIALILPAFASFSILLESIKESYRPSIFIAMGIPLFILLYLVTNLSQSFFYEGLSIKKSVRKSFAVAFTKIKDCAELILLIGFSVMLLGLLLLGSGYLVRLAADRNYMFYLNLYGYFRQASIISFYLVYYSAISINRISFYQITKKFSAKG